MNENSPGAGKNSRKLANPNSCSKFLRLGFSVQQGHIQALTYTRRILGVLQGPPRGLSALHLPEAKTLEEKSTKCPQE
jgi:hypothetical protein